MVSYFNAQPQVSRVFHWGGFVVKSCRFASSGTVSLCITLGDVNLHGPSSCGDSVHVLVYVFSCDIFYLLQAEKIGRERIVEAAESECQTSWSGNFVHRIGCNQSDNYKACKRQRIAT